MSSEDWTVITSVASAIGTIVAACGLVAATRGIRQNARATELQILESIFKDIRELDRQYIASFAGWDAPEKNAWSATFFNTVEYLCFVINRRMTDHGELKKFFFDEALPEWRKMFDKHVEDNVIGDGPAMFPEFKKAHRDLRGH